MQHLVRKLRLEALLVGEVANDPRDGRRGSVDGDRARRHHHGELGSIASYARGLDLAALCGGFAHRSVLLEELLERVEELRSHDRRDRSPDDVARRPAEHRFRGGVERAHRAVGIDGENPFRRVLDHRSVMRLAALRVVPRTGCLFRLFGELLLGPFLVLADRSGHTDRMGDR